MTAGAARAATCAASARAWALASATVNIATVATVSAARLSAARYARNFAYWSQARIRSGSVGGVAASIAIRSASWVGPAPVAERAAVEIQAA
ncbi:MAG: hypothetical protein IPL61_04815 [Myxococcales bacterium]|nr:hypothetical protein [Myxococcales bacterium]